MASSLLIELVLETIWLISLTFPSRLSVSLATSLLIGLVLETVWQLHTELSQGFAMCHQFDDSSTAVVLFLRTGKTYVFHTHIQHDFRAFGAPCRVGVILTAC